jgi:KUP system potassium uptake protein
MLRTTRLARRAETKGSYTTYKAAEQAGIPLTLTHSSHALHERVLLVAVRTSEEPLVPEDERAKIQDLPAGITRVTLHYGFMDSPSVPEGLRLAHEQAQLSCGNLSKISYYIGRETIVPTERIPGMLVWREGLYAFMQRNAGRTHIFAFR